MRFARNARSRTIEREISVIDVPPGPLGKGTPEDPRLVIETWFAVPTGGDWLTLLLRRSPKDGGFWQGVSGRVEAYDVSLRAAAMREIEEETGLRSPIEVFDLGRWRTFRGFSGTHYRTRSIGAVLPLGTSASHGSLSDEHDAVEVLPFAAARALLSYPANVEELLSLEAIVRARP